jgi:hypothetical protein
VQGPIKIIGPNQQTNISMSRSNTVDGHISIDPLTKEAVTGGNWPMGGGGSVMIQSRRLLPGSEERMTYMDIFQKPQKNTPSEFAIDDNLLNHKSGSP